MLNNSNTLIINQYSQQFLQIKEAVLNFKKNRICSWILSGKQGIGKSLFAKIIAQSLLDESGPHFELTAHPDFKLVTKIDDKELSIDQIREIIEFSHKTTSISSLKVIIIDDVDFMNKYTANALLKILEEPPYNLIIFLISHQIHSILPTIKSRAIKIKFKNPNFNSALEILNNNYNIELSKASELLKISNNSIGLALEINNLDVIEIYKNLLNHFPYFELSIQQELDKLSDELTHFLILRLMRLIVGFEINSSSYLDYEINFSQRISANHLISINHKFEVWNNINNYFMDLKFANLERKHIFYLIFNQFIQLSL